jgi:hypothetical protein
MGACISNSPSFGSVHYTLALDAGSSIAPWALHDISVLGLPPLGADIMQSPRVMLDPLHEELELLNGRKSQHFIAAFSCQKTFNCSALVLL